MNTGDLRKITLQAASAANKRYRRLSTSDIGHYSPAVKAAQKGGGAKIDTPPFSTKGKNLNQLRNEFKRIRQFMTDKTSTTRGFNKYKAETYKRLGGDFGESIQKERAFWRTYHKYIEAKPNAERVQSSTQVQQYLYRTMSSTRNLKAIAIKINEHNVHDGMPADYAVNMANEGVLIDNEGTLTPISYRKRDDILYLLMQNYDIEYEKRSALNGDDI